MIKTISLFLVCLMLAVGCATTSGGGVSDSRLAQFAVVAELASYDGTVLYLASNPAKKDVFVKVVADLDVLLDKGANLESFLKIVHSLPIKELKSTNGVLLIDNAIILFGVFSPDIAKLSDLEQINKLKPIVQSVRDGMARALK